MALTPEELGEVELELANRMKPKKDPMAALRPGESGFDADPASTVREGEALGQLGAMAGGGMGFGGINAAAQGAQLPEFNPESEKLLVDPAGMNAGAAASGGFSSGMSLANALRKGGAGKGQVPVTTPLE